MTRPIKLWFSILTFVTYLGQINFETGFGYLGNCIIRFLNGVMLQINNCTASL